MAQKGDQTSRLDYPTSINLDEAARDKLDKLSVSAGQSRSQVMRGLIMGADGTHAKRLAKIANDLNDLIGAA